ncbi:Mitoc-mL59 domain-containing protein [Favolaschia claudopus]|uniref:Mitoc-mL59 domain-containing protein n=1 Tax=Favolaschia claudopus TaxID=2862362 RepID=A0AAW0C9T2_9AGAR
MSTKFLHRELKALPRFVRRHGPLPNAVAADAVVLPNPFLPWRNPKSGRWAPSKYSLRQQADLIKQAKATNTVHLLPPSVKLPHPELFTPPPSPVKSTQAQAKTSASSSKAKANASPSPSVLQRASSGSRVNVKGPTKELKVKVEWDRRPREKTVVGADRGTRLYAAKRKMFKGSSLERARKQRAWRTWVLLHDMRKRIRRYRNHYVHKKRNPLKPTRKMAKKLPF